MLCDIFMKGFCIILLLTITTRLLSQDFELIIKGDTLAIREINITNDPFHFGDNPLNYLQKFNPTTTFKTYNNIHAENKVDTTFTLTIGKDTFEIIKWHKDQNWLFGANLTTNKFRTKCGLQIGMKKNDVIQHLSRYKLKSIPEHLILEETEVYQLIIFEFSADKLTSINFLGYSD